MFMNSNRIEDAMLRCAGATRCTAEQLSAPRGRCAASYALQRPSSYFQQLVDVVSSIAVSDPSARGLSRLRAREQPLDNSPLGKPLVELVYLRMSKINGCAFCLGINAVVLRAGGIRTM